MNYIITTIGVIVAVIGIVFATAPQLMNKFIEFAKVGKRIYIGGVVRLVLGGLLLFSSPQATVFWIPVIFGALIVLSGVAIFLLGPPRIHAYLDWWAGKPENIQRIGPVVAAVIGVLLIYSA
jgi:hypothetical protein